MGSGGGNNSVPPPPAMSAEEGALLAQQTNLLGQIGSFLNTSAAEGLETQNLYKDLSGLYDRVETPDTLSRTPETTKFQVDPGIIRSKLNRGARESDADYNARVSGSIKRAQEDPAWAQSMGYGRTVVTPGTETGTKGGVEYRLNKDKVEELRKKTGEYQGRADEIARLQTDRYMRALKGELPVSEGTLQRKNKEFSLLKEVLARRGNVIEGDTPETAMGLSSAAAQNLGEFNRTYGLIQDAERRGEIAGGGMGAGPGAGSLAYSTGALNYSPSNLVGGYQNLASGYGAASAPYANQRSLQYQGQLQNAALQMQGRGAAGNLLGMGGSALIASGNPAYMPWGAGALGAGYLLSR